MDDKYDIIFNNLYLKMCHIPIFTYFATTPEPWPNTIDAVAWVPVHPPFPTRCFNRWALLIKLHSFFTVNSVHLYLTSVWHTDNISINAIFSNKKKIESNKAINTCNV